MPGMNLPASTWLATKLNDFDQRLTNLEHQQLFIITNSTGAAIGRFGLQTDGTISAEFFDTAGHKRVAVGQLLNGDYGLQIVDLLGNQQELLPAVTSFNGNTLTTNSAVAAAITGGPSVSFDLGANLDADVLVSAQLTTAGSGGQAIYGKLDSNAAAEIMQFSSAGTDVTQTPMSMTFRLNAWATFYGLTALTAGAHTLTLWYTGVSGNSVYSLNYLKVQPV